MVEPWQETFLRWVEEENERLDGMIMALEKIVLEDIKDGNHCQANSDSDADEDPGYGSGISHDGSSGR